MANSKYEYVKEFEGNNTLLQSTFIVIRVDGKGFHKFTDFYKFKKPNDHNALVLMNEAAKLVMQSFPDLWLAYGQSDEYSFVLTRSSQLYKRRLEKIATTIGSAFTSAYTFYFKSIMGFDLVLPHLPVFDARCVCYPDIHILRDYLSWRQVDCHINNLYNTCFWSLVGSGVPKQEAEQILSKTNAGDKNELLFARFGLNYNNIAEIYKKGTIIIKEQVVGSPIKLEQQQIELDCSTASEKLSKKQRNKLKQKDQQQPQQQQGDLLEYHSQISVLHLDIIKEDFWVKYRNSLPIT